MAVIRDLRISGLRKGAITGGLRIIGLGGMWQ